MRDWFPISFMGSFTDWADVTHGAEKEFGQLTCGCHPNCGVGMAIMIDKETKEAVPVTAFLKAEQLAKDVAAVSDAGRGRFLSVFGMALALVRNYDSFKSPTHFKLTDLLKKFDKTFGATKSAEKGKYGKVEGDRTSDDIAKRRADRWNFLFIAGHVVPGSVQLRLPPHRDVHHPVCHAAGRNLLLRLQHRHRLAQHHREDAHDGDAHQVVRGARPPRDLRRQQGGAAHLDRALAEAERGSGRARARRPTSTTSASPRTRAKKSWRRASTRQPRSSRRKRRTTPRWPSSTRSTCSRSSRRCRFRDSAARRRRRTSSRCCTSRRRRGWG